MDKEAALKKIKKECRNIGDKCAAHFYRAGIFGIDDLKALGAEEAFFKIWQKDPSKICINSAYLYALEGAITDENWSGIPEKRKKQLQKYAQDLRESYR